MAKKLKNDNEDIPSPLLPTSFLTAPKDNKYKNAIDFLTKQSGTLNAISKQINFTTVNEFQKSIQASVTGLQNHISAFNSLKSHLPTIDNLIVASPIVDLS